MILNKSHSSLFSPEINTKKQLNIINCILIQQVIKEKRLKTIFIILQFHMKSKKERKKIFIYKNTIQFKIKNKKIMRKMHNHLIRNELCSMMMMMIVMMIIIHYSLFSIYPSILSYYSSSSAFEIMLHSSYQGSDHPHRPSLNPSLLLFSMG